MQNTKSDAHRNCAVATRGLAQEMKLWGIRYPTTWLGISSCEAVISASRAILDQADSTYLQAPTADQQMGEAQLQHPTRVLPVCLRCHPG
eukprot:1272591-Amphidinium_carterae.1